MKLALLFGGLSHEHEISIVSAIALQKLLPTLSHFIFIDANRDFYLIPATQMRSSHFAQGGYKKNPKLTLENGGFFTRSLFGAKRLEFDALINLIHGGDGEDGKLAGILEFFKIPFIGPRLEASVLSFNKHLTKLYAKECGVKTLPYLLARQGEKRDFGNEYPMIIKPARLGSSIGVSVAKNRNELDYALDVAFEFDNEVLLEPFIQGVKEYNLAGYKAGDSFHFSLVEEPQKHELLDFEKKYLDFSRTQRTQRADLSPVQEKALKEAFVKLYEPLFEGSLIRCDFFIHEGEVWLNEINPIPGSLANYLFEDFQGAVETLARNLPSAKAIPVDYRYINQIQRAKGK